MTTTPTGLFTHYPIPKLGKPIHAFPLPDGQFYCITQGLAASGKTTWAETQRKVLGMDRVTVVCRDYIRADRQYYHGGKLYDPRLEKDVRRQRDLQINSALNQGLSVIVADTNLYAKTVEEHRCMAAEHHVPFLINDTFIKNVSIEECLKRDQGRPGMVGKDVIERQYYDWWAGAIKPANNGHRAAILCDLDGTFALIPKGANPYDRDFTRDGVNIAVRDVLLSAYQTHHEIIFMSGREDKYREMTETWLSRADVWFHASYQLYMRPTDDNRKDTVVKKEMYMETVQPSDNRVHYVLDDRPSVVRMWRAELGLTCFQVGPNLEF